VKFINFAMLKSGFILTDDYYCFNIKIN